MTSVNIINIILDMDGTILDYVPPHFDDNLSHKIIPIARPYLHLFMKYLFDNFERVSIWTAATKDWFDECYEKILKPSIPEGKGFHFVKTRADYNYYAGLKQLKLVYSEYPDLYNSKNTLIIDDNPHTFAENKEQALQIKSLFYDRLPKKIRENLDKHDFELYNMIQILNDINHHNSIPFIESTTEKKEEDSEEDFLQISTHLERKIKRMPSQVFDIKINELYDSVAIIGKDW